MPYDERPAELPLDTEECRTALYIHNGNISEAAERLKVSSARLRAFVKASAYLTRESDEFRQRIADRAEAVILEGLYDDREKYTMARYVAASLGKQRGYNQNSPTSGKATIGPMTISWGEPESTTIDGEMIDVSTG